MKRIVIIVPDQIDCTIGTFRRVNFIKENITMENIAKVLCDRSEYHQHYFFKDPDSVRIESIEDYID